ncbi:hypothetical protein G7054_g11756 [Neopestalotiopsis clavispora]|nr:hypothetical protein G7054_g11756 [Neopestalotiopsis clavispora]
MSSDTARDPFKLRVLIIGGGLCGLATAIAVTEAGHSATVFEATDRPRYAGAGILSSPNGTQLLSRWGVLDLLQWPIEPDALKIHDLNGDLISENDSFNQEVSHTYGFPLCAHHRGDLENGLRQRALEMGVKVLDDSPVYDLDVHTRTIKVELGDYYSGDLIVVADGTRSTLRSKVLGGMVKPCMTGNVAYRITLHRQRLDDESASEFMGSVSHHSLHIWAGPEAHIIGYHLRNRDTITLSIVMPGDSKPEISGTDEIVEELRNRLHGSDERLMALLKGVQRATRWHQVEVSGFPSSSLPPGVVLAGDSYHTLRPSLSQGFNLGLEDAATLGSLLSHVTSTDQISSAGGMYEMLRFSRVQQVQEATERYERGVLSTERMSRAIESPSESITNTDPDWEAAQAEIWCYDAYREAERAWVNEPF